MNIGEKIYTLRSQRNLSQEGLADLLAVSRQSISKWETDASIPELDKLIRLCEVFGITLDELVGRESVFEKAAAPVPSSSSTAGRKIPIGNQVAAFAFIALCFFFLIFDSYTFLITVVLIIMSLICLLTQKRTLFYCLGVASVMVEYGILELLTLADLPAFTLISRASYCVLFIPLTLFFFKDTHFQVGIRQWVYTALFWLGHFALYGSSVLLPYLNTQGEIPFVFISKSFTHYAQQLLFLCISASFIAAVTYTICCVRNTIIQRKSRL
ncbi:MAG: helix-turn-helix transcriptional regulator [Clostridia bacterium]|nr:helix-turn-helix transcriptional regulator [Clostridia bacterium]